MRDARQKIRRLAGRPGDLPLAAVVGIEPSRATPTHCHAPGQLFGPMRGVLTIGTDAGLWVLPAGHAVWMPPWHRHSMRSHGAFAGASVYVAEPACAALPATPRALRWDGLLREAVVRAAGWDDAPADESRRRIAALILDEIRAAAPVELGLPLPVDARLRRIAHALLDDLADPRGLEDWAAAGAVSARTLTRRWIAETGRTFADWRQRARMMRAIERLAAGAAVTAVALDLGYDNVSAFITAFRRVHGTTPGRWREDAP
jgi:AraC-like DNA-binding protein/quercetin dioxygenase-like cupin family protein